MSNFLRHIFTACFAVFIYISSLAQSGNALQFDGVDDHVSRPLPAFFTTDNDFTIEAWVYPQGSVFSRIVFAQLSTTNFAALSTNTGNTIYFYVMKNGTTYSVATTGSIPQNQWTHVAARWTSASNTPEVFFNGVLQATGSGGSSSTGTNNTLSIGARPGGAQYFPGQLDEVRIWTTARTVCNINATMNKILAGNEPGLGLYYNFNNGIAGGNNAGTTTLVDLVAGNNGTLSNFALTGNTSNWVASGVTLSPGGSNNTTENISVCAGSSHTFPDGSVQNNITAPTTHTSLLQGTNGCDSTVITNLTVNPTYTSNNPQVICQGDIYNFNGNNYITAGNYNDTLQSVLGCDSIVVTQLTVNPAYISDLAQSICSGEVYDFAGEEYSTAGSYQGVFQTISGCDSIVTLVLTVNTIDTTVTQTTLTLSANENGASYQWLYCANNSIVDGFTSQSFTAPAYGFYAAIITKNGCTDTSACYMVGENSLPENGFENTINLFPNPTTGVCTIQLTQIQPEIEIGITNVLGQLVDKRKYFETSLLNVELPQANGVYFISIRSGKQSATVRVLRQ